jgi:acyl-CoA reductase-like NAD-dependent aldehyde dehydrogenase
VERRREEATAFAAFFHSGQICMDARKVLVERPVYATFVERLVAQASSRFSKFQLCRFCPAERV